VRLDQNGLEKSKISNQSNQRDQKLKMQFSVSFAIFVLLTTTTWTQVNGNFDFDKLIEKESQEHDDAGHE